MRALSDRERKLVAVLILFSIVGLVWFAVVEPVISGFRERASQRALLTQRYQANQRVIGSIPRLRRQAERQREDLRNFVLSAPMQATAIATLQDRVQSTIDATGAEVRSVEDISDSLSQVRVRASARMTLVQMTEAIARLSNAPPYLVVESLEVSADQAAISGRLDIMEVNFDVSVPFVASQSRG